MTHSRACRLILSLMAVVVLFIAPAAFAQPAGDLCADAQVISCGGSATVDNSTATTDPGDPIYSCRAFGGPDQGAGTVWYKFVAADTTARLSTCTSTTAADTLIGLYEGDCGALTEIACNDDACGNGLLSSMCVSNLVIGQTYYVQVASFSEQDAGEITLNLACPCPTGENCANAHVLTLPTGPISFNNSENAASDEAPSGSCNFEGDVMFNDEWFTFTTGAEDCTMIINLDAVEGSYDLIATVYSGTDCGSLVEEVCLDQPDHPGFISIFAFANTPYWIRIGDFGNSFGGGGETTLEVSCPTDLPVGACCSAIDGGCYETNEPSCVFSGDLYQGDGVSCASGPCRTACCLPGPTCMPVTGLVLGFPQADCETPVESGGLGGLWLGPASSCEFSACPPANDDCPDAEALTLPAHVTFNNDNARPSATPDAGSCNSTDGDAMDNDTWFTLTTGSTACELRFELTSTNFYDMIVTIYTGTDCDSLTEVSCADEPQDPLRFSLTALPETLYWIRVGDGFVNEGGGETTMSIVCTVACETCPGDVNGDTLFDGRDIEDFAACFLAGGAGETCGCSDVNRDGLVDDEDTELFVDLLLTRTGLCSTACSQESSGQPSSPEASFFSDGEQTQQADNFHALANGQITHVRWWGHYTPEDICPIEADNFSIIYYADNNGRPGAVKAGPFHVASTREATGRLLLDLAPEFVFDALHEPVNVSAGECVWISIINPTTAGCFWYWMMSPSGDGWLATTFEPGQWPRETRLPGDLSWCLDIAIDPAGCPAPTGTCCLPGNLCTDTTEADCGGVWNYDENCQSFVCADLPTDSCAEAPLVPCNSTVTVDNSGAATDFDDPGYSCHAFGGGLQGVGTMWCRFVASDTTALLQTCDSFAFDTILGVYEGTCGALTELACGDNDCGFDFFSQGQVCVKGLTIGQPYYVQIASTDEFTRGPITLNIQCPSPCPPNDDCPEAIAVQCGDTVVFDNTFARPTPPNAPDPADPFPTCSIDEQPPQATMWYTFVGNGQTWTIESCNTPNEDASNADTTLSVWTGGCDVLVEAACGEDDCPGGDVNQQGGEPQPWMSRVVVPTVNGQQYWIMWSNGYPDRGNVQMNITCAP